MAAFIAPIFSLIDRILPDRAANDAAKAELLKMQVTGELQTTLAQIDVDKQEAASNSLFVAGWRPAVGWTCAVAFFYVYVLQPFLQFVLVAFHVSFDVSRLPVLNLSDMLPVLLGMLGLGAYRTIDKAKGKGNGA